MPWRDDPSSYKVLVSELMLQQTQVSRVIPKFETFMYTCENFAALANVSLAEVLQLWSGLGYNRRAKYLHQTAQIIARDYDGVLPSTHEQLVRLPGIGVNTAGAILAYAFNQPVVFIETNVRTVLFHHFFADSTDKVSDKELRHIAEQVLDRSQPREWYWALMDYGSYLKKTAGGRLGSSAHYAKQSPLKGSLREMRGRIIKTLSGGPLKEPAMRTLVDADERFAVALEALIDEGLVERRGDDLGLTGYKQTA